MNRKESMQANRLVGGQHAAAVAGKTPRRSPRRQRPLVIALHGAVGAPDDWLALGTDLGLGDNDLLAWDLAGWAGGCGPGFASWTREFLAAARALGRGGRPLGLLGYSLGARLALHALAKDRSLFAFAVLVAPHPGLADADTRASRLADDRCWARSCAETGWNQFLREWEARPVFAAGRPVAQWRPDLRDAWRRARLRLEGHRHEVAASLECWSLGHQRPLLPVLARRAAGAPVLWVTGALDTKFTAIGREACRVLPASRHVEVAGAGHRVPWEVPEAFGKLFNTWVRKFA